jgi:hypothetical protein
MEEPEAFPPRLLEVPDEPVQELTPEQQELQDKRDKAQMCKVIVLSEMGLHPLTTNTNDFNTLKKRVLLEKIKLLFEDEPIEKIKEKFDVITEEILSSKDKENDYTKFSVYKRNI